MKRIVFFLALLAICNIGVTQASIYIVVTTVNFPIEHVGVFNGFGRFLRAENYLTKGVSQHYLFGTTERDYMIEFNHVNYKGDSVGLEILDLPISALNNFETVIEAEELMQFATADMAYKWMLNHLENKTKIYIIDRRDFYKSDPDLAAPNMMKVVEVEIWYEDLPNYILY